MKLRLYAGSNRIYSIAPISLIVLALLVATPASGGQQAARAAASVANAPVVLYNAALGTTPDKQGFQYQAINGANPFVPPAATQVYANGATTLDTTTQKNDLAGYAAATPDVPVLDRSLGYSVDFAVQIQQEDHAGSDRNGDNIDDRAGFSLIVLSSDKKGVELGFWKDEIWIQNDGTAEPPGGTLFTHGEGATFDTNTDLISYTLSIKGDSYSLSSGGAAILSGTVRDYTAWEAPPQVPTNPYRTPNLIVLSDDSTSASAKIKLTYIGVTLPKRAVYVPLLRR
jgi:hypothetical protein